MDRAAQLFADDLIAGLRFRGETTTLTPEHFTQFAALTGDKHPIHYDASYAAGTRFGRPPAHGLLLTSLTALGATRFSESLEDAMIALVEQHMQFLRPAFAGDIIVPDFEIVSNRATASGRAGRVEILVRLLNQNGESVLEGRHVYLFRHRPDATSQAGG
jgi:3-hydroxybutyryl-CoA dehydratase